MSRPPLTARKMNAEEADPARGAAHRDRTAGLGVESVEEEPLLPKFDYHLDESDPDILVLRRQDGSFVAAFSARVPPRKGSPKPPRRIIGCLWRLIPTRLVRR